MDVSKNRGTPKWMVKIMENPIKMGWFGGFSYYFWRDTHISIFQIPLIPLIHTNWHRNLCIRTLALCLWDSVVWESKRLARHLHEFSGLSKWLSPCGFMGIAAKFRLKSKSQDFSFSCLETSFWKDLWNDIFDMTSFWVWFSSEFLRLKKITPQLLNTHGGLVVVGVEIQHHAMKECYKILDYLASNGVTHLSEQHSM